MCWLLWASIFHGCREGSARTQRRQAMWKIGGKKQFMRQMGASHKIKSLYSIPSKNLKLAIKTTNLSIQHKTVKFLFNFIKKIKHFWFKINLSIQHKPVKFNFIQKFETYDLRKFINSTRNYEISLSNFIQKLKNF